MRVLKMNLRLSAVILLLLAGGALAMVRAHQVKHNLLYPGVEKSVESTILINSQQAVSELPVTRVSN